MLQKIKVERKKNLTKGYIPPKPEPKKRINIYEPQYKHDCEHCTFLRRKENMDYYVHVNAIGAEPTFLVRYGDSPEEYSSFSMSSIISMMLDGYVDDPLVDCMKYAIRNDRVRISYKAISVFGYIY